MDFSIRPGLCSCYCSERVRSRGLGTDRYTAGVNQNINRVRFQGGTGHFRHFHVYVPFRTAWREGKRPWLSIHRLCLALD